MEQKLKNNENFCFLAKLIEKLEERMPFEEAFSLLNEIVKILAENFGNLSTNANFRAGLQKISVNWSRPLHGHI